MAKRKASALDWFLQPLRAPENQYVLHLFSGPQTFMDSTTLKSKVRALSSRTSAAYPDGIALHVVEVDYVNCGCVDENNRPLPNFCRGDRHSRTPCWNLMAADVYADLLHKCRSGKVVAVVAGIPCNSYCVARLAMDGHARALRDRDHPTGLPPGQLDDRDRGSLALNNALTVRSLTLCAAAYEAGAEVMIENPPDKGELGLWATNQYTGELDDSWYQRHPEFKRHAPLWLTPWYKAFAMATHATFLNFAQCTFLSEFQKYTTLAVTPGWRRDADRDMSAFDDRPCRCQQRHTKSAHGRRPDGTYISAEAARYPEGMNAQIAKACHTLAGKRLRAPISADALEERKQALLALWSLLDSVETQKACDADSAGRVFWGGGWQPTIRGMLPGAAAPAAAPVAAPQRGGAPLRPSAGTDGDPDAAGPDAAGQPQPEPILDVPCGVANPRVSSKRYREELGIPDDEPEVVHTLAALGVPTERLSEYANRTLVGGEFGPRTGMSDARHVLRAIKGGRVKPEAGELYELVVKPLVEGLYDDARLT